MAGAPNPAATNYLFALEEEESQKQAQLAAHHEENIKSLKSRITFFDKYLHHLNLELDGHRRRHSSGQSSAAAKRKGKEVVHDQSNLLDQTAAGVICQLTEKNSSFLSVLSTTKDILGIVASLGKVAADNENLSSILSEYLGRETMLAIVCKSPSGVRALECYEKDGAVDKDFGIHALAPVIGRSLEGRFLVYCLQMLRPFTGSVFPGDAQRRLALVEPRLPSGNPPRGFLGFAVNMIYLDERNLAGVNSDGLGLRETLFYTLFSRLQVYETRKDMIEAMPFITDGAVSLDGGIVKGNGARFVLGDRCCDSEVIRFAGIGENDRPSFQPVKVMEIEQMIQFAEWKKGVVISEIQSEEAKINEIKSVLNAKSEAYKKHIAEEIQNRLRR